MERAKVRGRAELVCAAREPLDEPGLADAGAAANRARSIIALNAGAGIYVSGVASSLKEGIVAAEEVIASGAAQDKLDAFAEFTRQTAAEQP